MMLDVETVNDAVHNCVLISAPYCVAMIEASSQCMQKKVTPRHQRRKRFHSTGTKSIAYLRRGTHVCAHTLRCPAQIMQRVEAILYSATQAEGRQALIDAQKEFAGGVFLGENRLCLSGECFTQVYIAISHLTHPCPSVQRSSTSCSAHCWCICSLLNTSNPCTQSEPTLCALTQSMSSSLYLILCTSVVQLLCLRVVLVFVHEGGTCVCARG